MIYKTFTKMMDMIIRHTAPGDLDAVMEIYGSARHRMRLAGNHSQWIGGYPSRERIMADIDANVSYVVEAGGVIAGVFAFIQGEEPTYRNIDGRWPDDRPYGTIHRIAANGVKKGVFAEVLAYCERKIPHLRIDTHRNNHIMQHLIEKHGFRRCGTIYISDGSPRIAYEKIPEGLLPVY